MSAAFPPPPKLDSLSEKAVSAIADDDLEYFPSNYVAKHTKLTEDWRLARLRFLRSCGDTLGRL